MQVIVSNAGNTRLAPDPKAAKRTWPNREFKTAVRVHYDELVSVKLASLTSFISTHSYNRRSVSTLRDVPETNGCHTEIK